VLLVLLVAEMLSVAAVQMALMGERSARSHRDAEVAWQAAEAALADAELDMTQIRTSVFDGNNAAAFSFGCGTSSTTKGLCANADSDKPAWLTVDFTDASGPSVAYGELTGRVFNAGESGARPAMAPRYVIELVPDTSGTPGSNYVYRVSAMGFGPRPDIQVVLQMVYRV
jgi:type IV pilus assembly protein PilX